MITFYKSLVYSKCRGKCPRVLFCDLTGRIIVIVIDVRVAWENNVTRLNCANMAE